MPAQKVEAAMPMAPYPSKMLVKSVRGTDPAELADAIGAVADLEWWTRGGSDYDDEVAMTLAVRRAAGVGLRLKAVSYAPARDPRGAALLARAGVLVQGALLDGLVDPSDQRAVLGLDRLGVAGFDGALEPAEMRLDRAGVATVLVVLSLGAEDALLL